MSPSLKEFLWTICDARVYVAHLAILVHAMQDVSHCVLILRASHYIMTFCYRDLDIFVVKLFHEAYSTIKDMFWHCQPLWWILVFSPNARMIKNSLLFDINLCIWCVRFYVEYSRRRSYATAPATANVVSKWEDTSSNGSILCFLDTQRAITGETHKGSRKFLRILGALTAYSSVPWYHLEMRTFGRKRVVHAFIMA